MQILPTAFLSAALSLFPGSPSEPPPVLWADFDGDGLLDAYLADPRLGDRLLRNAGAGRFDDVSVDFGLGGNRSRSALLADLDGDGRAELVRVTEAGELRLHRGGADAVFGAALPIGASGPEEELERIEGLDVDGDDDPDLVATTAAGGVVLLENLGRLEFAWTRLRGGAAGPAWFGRTPVRPRDDTSSPAGASVAGRSAHGAAGRPGTGRVAVGATARQGVQPTPPAAARGATGLTADALFDQGSPGGKLQASTTPILGMLHPLSSDLFLDPGGRVGLGTTSPEARLHLKVEGLGLAASSLNSDDLAIESADAILGLYSDWSGSFGSGIVLGQLDPSGLLTDKWSIVRGSVVSPDLHFSFGPSAAYNLNPKLVTFTTAGEIGLGTSAPLAALHVKQQDLSLSGAAVNSDDLLIESSDAILGLYSTSGGSYGSGVILGEVSGGALVNKWALVRRTASVRNLELTFGTSDAYNGNPTLFTFADEGDLRIGSTSTRELTLAEGAIRQEQANLEVRAEVDLSLVSQNDLFVSSSNRLALQSNGDLTLDSQTGIAVQNDALVVNAGTKFVGIGTTTPVFKLHVNGNAGKPGGGSWSVASDIRLKKNVKDLEGALERLLALRGVTYEYIDPEAIGELDGVRTGMVAQEVERVFPEWVEPAEDGYLRLTFRGFEALTVEALRDLREEKDAEIADLRAELAATNERLAALERLLTASGARSPR